MASTVGNISNAVSRCGSLRFALAAATASLQFCASANQMAAFTFSLIQVVCSKQLYYIVSVSLRSPSSAAHGYAFAAPHNLCAISLSSRSRLRRRDTHRQAHGNKLRDQSLRLMARNSRALFGGLLGR